MNIDLAQATVHVTRSLSYCDPDGTSYTFKEEEPKTASSRRTIPLPEFALDALQRHRVRIIAYATAVLGFVNYFLVNSMG